jgi:hypothetical protein
MVEQTPIPTPGATAVPEAMPTGFALRLARVGENAYHLGANMLDTVAYPLGLSWTEPQTAPLVTAHGTFDAA